MKPQKQQASFSTGKWGLAILLIIVLGWLYYPSGPRTKTPTTKVAFSKATTNPDIPYTHQEAEAMMAAVFSTINPARPENQYMPIFAREKVAWALKENAAKHLLFNLNEESKLSLGGIPPLATASYINGQPALQFFIQRFVNLGLADFKAGRPFSRLFVNNLYYGITHEVVHLELGPEEFLHTQSPEHHIQEEMRTWTICDINVVRPLGLQKEILFKELYDADFLLANCNDDWQHCEPFRKFITERTF